MNQNHYNTFKTEKIVAFIAIMILTAVIGVAIGTGAGSAEDQLVKCYALCKPGSQVNVRATPDINGQWLGYLECGDDFETDGESENGWIRCYGIGEMSGWVYVGYVSTEKPQKVGQRYVCVSNAKVICRRWQGGPQIVDNGKRRYLKNGQNVAVFCVGDGWAVTDRGYVRAEYLEADPE